MKCNLAEIFIKLPKTLLLAICFGVGKSQPTFLLVYLIIADRFNNKKGSKKICYDNNEMIGKRSGLSKKTVERALSWLSNYGFLEFQYQLKIQGPKGATVRSFESQKQAFRAWQQYASQRVACNLLGRIILPIEDYPSLKRLGLFLVSKNQGLYTTDPNCAALTETNSDQIENNVLGEDKNDVIKLDPFDENLGDSDSFDDIDLDEKTHITSGMNLPFQKMDFQSNQLPTLDFAKLNDREDYINPVSIYRLMLFKQFFEEGMFVPKILLVKRSKYLRSLPNKVSKRMLLDAVAEAKQCNDENLVTLLKSIQIEFESEVVDDIGDEGGYLQ
jgi:hypothetical protein